MSNCNIVETIDNYPLFRYLSELMSEEENAAEDEQTAERWKEDWQYIYSCYLVKEGYDLA